MSKNNFEVKKGLNVRDGRFIADENEVSIDGVGVITQTELTAESNARIAADAVLQSNIDAAIANGIDELTTAEVNQLKNIDSNTISNAQWGYVGSMNQNVSTTSSPSFSQISSVNSVITQPNDAIALDINVTQTNYNSAVIDVDVLNSAGEYDFINLKDNGTLRFGITQEGGVYSTNVNSTSSFSGALVVGQTDCVLDPRVDVTGTAYTFDTLNTLTSGKIASFLNNTVEKAYIDTNGLTVNGTITGAEPWDVRTGMIDTVADNWTALNNKKYMVDTTSRTTNVTMTMPAAVNVGDTVTVTDMKGLFAPAGTQNVITDTATFNGVSQTWEFDVANSTTVLVWTGASYGWKTIITQP